MVAIFFRASGIVSVVPLENRATATAAWYINTCLPTINNIQKTCPKTMTLNSFFHHDNAPAHKATTSFLEQSQLDLLPHPLYSPDLAPSDFFLFPLVKKGMKGRKFHTREEILSALKS